MFKAADIRVSPYLRSLDVVMSAAAAWSGYCWHLAGGIKQSNLSERSNTRRSHGKGGVTEEEFVLKLVS